ncbi:MAG: hypothetical protein MAG581_01878 [Deltaproteobacteria bacterium]|jgi:hypothetical protein|nr:hypothetical protein [Deltaproteobacteria bacterium]
MKRLCIALVLGLISNENVEGGTKDILDVSMDSFSFEKLKLEVTKSL